MNTFKKCAKEFAIGVAEGIVTGVVAVGILIAYDKFINKDND